MDLFQTEQSRVEKILEENYLIALQELGLEGHYVLKSLSEAKEIVEGSRSNPEPREGEAKILLAKNLLNTYSANASVLIKRITGVLTEIRYMSFLPNLIVDKRLPPFGFQEPPSRDVRCCYFYSLPRLPLLYRGHFM